MKNNIIKNMQRGAAATLYLTGVLIFTGTGCNSVLDENVSDPMSPQVKSAENPYYSVHYNM